jgi:hypothetical protein
LEKKFSDNLDIENVIHTGILNLEDFYEGKLTEKNIEIFVLKIQCAVKSLKLLLRLKSRTIYVRLRERKLSNNIIIKAKGIKLTKMSFFVIHILKKRSLYQNYASSKRELF